MSLPTQFQPLNVPFRWIGPVSITTDVSGNGSAVVEEFDKPFIVTGALRVGAITAGEFLSLQCRGGTSPLAGTSVVLPTVSNDFTPCMIRIMPTQLTVALTGGPVSTTLKVFVAVSDSKVGG